MPVVGRKNPDRKGKAETSGEMPFVLTSDSWFCNPAGLKQDVKADYACHCRPPSGRVSEGRDPALPAVLCEIQ
jgi:hypothetical protein